MKQKPTLIAICALAVALAPAAMALNLTPVRPQGHSLTPAPATPHVTVVKAKPYVRHAMKSKSGSLTADFTVQGGASQDTIWSENFDKGDALSAWTANQGEGSEITFTLKATTGKKAFSAIDASDVQSLHIEGPYKTYKRTIGTLTSAPMSVTSQSMFRGYAWVSPTMNDYAVLSVTASDDDFSTQKELWNSTQAKQTGWAAIEANLDSFAGKQVKIRLTYGPGTEDNFKTGGYMADFYVDGLTVTGASSVSQVEVLTGEPVKLANLSGDEATSYEWKFPGGTPATSTERDPEVFYTLPGTYDVTLTARNDTDSATITRPAFVKVRGQKPTAAITAPAQFRYNLTGEHFVAPLVPVQWKDASTGYPTSWTWGFSMGDDPTTGLANMVYSHEQNPWISYNALGSQQAVLVVENDSGSVYTYDSCYVAYSGLADNILGSDKGATVYDMESDGTFPGANKLGVSAIAEKFSRPSRPMKIWGGYVLCTEATASDISDQVHPITFSICKSENGVPGKMLDMDSWTIPELGYAIRTAKGMVQITFNKPVVVDDEFFLVIDGLPQKNDSLKLSFAMTNMRSEGNTLYMRKADGTWRELTGYFQEAPGGQASLYAFLNVGHSVITPVAPNDKGTLVASTDTIHAGCTEGITKQQLFSYLGYRYVSSSQPWCKITNKPNGLTLDTLSIYCEALPAGSAMREAVLTLTDSIDTVKLHVIQDPATAISRPAATEGRHNVRIFSLDGREQTACPNGLQGLPKGVYIVRDEQTGQSRKVVVK